MLIPSTLRDEWVSARKKHYENFSELNDNFKKIKKEFGAPPKGTDLRDKNGQVYVFYYSPNETAKKWAESIRKKYPNGIVFTDTSKIKNNINENYGMFQPTYGETVLNGMSNSQARNYVRKISKGAYHGGLYKDEYWEGPTSIKKALGDANIEFETVSNDYHNWPPQDSFKSSGKTWKLVFPFINNSGKETLLHGTITAAGAGSIEDPLDKYDMNFTIFEENNI